MLDLLVVNSNSNVKGKTDKSLRTSPTVSKQVTWKKFKVFYPTMYAVESENKDAKLFNCVQRGHQNSVEVVMPLFFAMLLVGGLRHPAVATGLGLLYTVARLFYFTGYATGVPRNRMKIGRLSILAGVGLIACTASFGINLVLRKTL